MTNAKEIAGRRAAEFVESGMTVGLGTGSTVYFTLVRLAERIREEGLQIRGVPTSLDTEQKANEFGIPLAGLDEIEHIDFTIDGADEIDAQFNMIKGGGGALLREKVIAHISRCEAIVVGRDKVVDRLGTTFKLPVEVVPFAQPMVELQIRSLGAEPEVRSRDGGVFVTDNGNHILDCHFPEGIANAPAMERALDEIPGVVESGLFIGLAHLCVVGEQDGSCAVLKLEDA